MNTIPQHNEHTATHGITCMGAYLQPTRKPSTASSVSVELASTSSPARESMLARSCNGT